MSIVSTSILLYNIMFLTTILYIILYTRLQLVIPSVPAPTAVTVIPPAGRIVAGSRSSSLTCTIELNPAVDIPVTVTTEWSGPERIMFLPDKVIPAVMVNLTVYTSTATISVAINGSYTCQAAVSPDGTTSGSINITVGIYICFPVCVSVFDLLCFLCFSPPPSTHYSDSIQPHSYLHHSDLGAVRGS